MTRARRSPDLRVPGKQKQVRAQFKSTQGDDCNHRNLTGTAAAKRACLLHGECPGFVG